MNVSISGNARNVAKFFEACNMGAEALKKVDKYCWHNLKKDPMDLPNEYGKYLVINSKWEFDVLYYCKDAKCFGYERCLPHPEFEGCPNEYCFEPIDEKDSPIEWKEIEF